MNKSNIKLIATHFKDVFVVWTNTDLTEGRGAEYPLAVCEKESTAKRLAKGNYVMGTDCRYTQGKAYYINNNWYVNGRVVQPSREDSIIEVQLEAQREKDKKKAAAIEKAKKLGLSEEDIQNLK